MTGPEKAKLRKALVDAFTSAEMEMFINEYFNESSLAIAPIGIEGDYEFRVFKLIQHFRMRDRLVDLVAATRERRPKNADIAAVAEKLGLTVTGVRFDAPPGEPAQPLERIVQQYARFINPTAFRERMGPLEGQVCWIAVPGGGGTGFLVGPDLVLTNYHVMANVKANPAWAPNVVLRFDFKQTTDGQPVLRSKITECHLAAAEWCIDGKPPSAKDWDAALGDASLDELVD